MGAYSLRFNLSFKNTMAVSFVCHILFFSGVYFTFSRPRVSEDATVFSFFGSMLGTSDLNINIAHKASNVFASKVKMLYHRRELNPGLSDLSISYAKPIYLSGETTNYSKRLNKFLVVAKKADIQNKIEPKSFEPAKWQKLELKLNSE